MNKLLTSLLLSVTLMGGVQAQKKENYYVKHVSFLRVQLLNRKSIWQHGWYPLRSNMPGSKWN